MNTTSKIYIAGHAGLVGGAVVRQLQKLGYTNLILRDRSELDLVDQVAVHSFMKRERPEFVIDCAAKVGGIKSNMTYPAEFIYENLQIQNNLMWSAKESDVKKFLFLASAVIYPKNAVQPMKEQYFMQGAPDPGNAAYAHAKIAGIKMCEYIYDEFGLTFISCAPTNLYGEHDNFDPDSAHVVPALIQRMYRAKLEKSPEVHIWGTGNGRREFIYVADLADAIIWMMNNYDEKQFLNIGTGQDISIKELAEMIKVITGYDGKLVFDPSKPEGSERRLLDVTELNNRGWKHQTELQDGLEKTYSWFLENVVKDKPN